MRKLKTLIIITAALACSTAGAAIVITADGTVDPPDSEVVLWPGRIAEIGLYNELIDWSGGFYLFGISLHSTGSGLLDIDQAVMLYPAADADIGWIDDPEIAAYLEIENPFIYVDLGFMIPPIPPVCPTCLPSPWIVEGISFECTDYGDVALMLFDMDGMLLDSQVIHQLPEPLTFCLLGSAALLALRKHRYKPLVL